MKKPTAATIVHLPPIFDILLLSIAPSDYRACSLVCTDWCLVFFSHTWHNLVLNYARPYTVRLQDPFVNSRIYTVRDLTIQGRQGLDPFLFYIDKRSLYYQRALQLRAQRGFSINTSRYMLENQLTRLAFEEWGFIPSIERPLESIPWTNYNVTEQLLRMNKESLEAVDFSFRLLSSEQYQSVNFNFRIADIVAKMGSLASLILRGPSLEISVGSLFRLLINCPVQLQTLKVEHPIMPLEKNRGNHLQHWLSDPELLNRLGTSLFEISCTWYGRPCRCLIHMNELWSQALPTQIRELSLPYITDNEETRPVLMPFLKRRCPKLQSLKIKHLGSLPLDLLRSSLNIDLFPRLNQLEFDGIRSQWGSQDMFSVYDLVMKACIALHSFTISSGAKDVENVSKLVTMVLEKHGKTLKTLRWLGSGGSNSDRLDLQWFLSSCPQLERIELTSDNRTCFSGQCALGAIVISDAMPVPLRLDSSQEPASSKLQLTRTLSLLNKSSASLTLERPWVCASTLTYLEISFRPAFNIMNEYRYKAQIEYFYRQLGQLKALVELHLGCECRCHGLQLQTCQHMNCWDLKSNEIICKQVEETGLQDKNTIASESAPDPIDSITRDQTTIFDMSLATGLDHMKELRKLQVLNISRIHGHNVEILELEWMKTHWPELRWLQGLKRSHLVEWLEVNWSRVQVTWCNCKRYQMQQSYSYHPNQIYLPKP